MVLDHQNGRRQIGRMQEYKSKFQKSCPTDFYRLIGYRRCQLCKKGRIVLETENKMGTQPVAPLLISMSIPMMISMLVQALYNIVDSIFVAQIGENALTAVSLAFPWQNLMIAVAVGTGVGVNAMLSRWLGAGKKELVKSCADHSLILALLSSLVFAVLGVCLSNLFFSFQTDAADIVAYGDQYMRIVSACCTGLFIGCTCEKLLSATGRTTLTMVTQLIGAIVNIILDPILIFGYFGLPALGVAGAAIATVIGQWCGAAAGLYLNLRHNPDISISYKGFHWNGQVVHHIYSVGLPSIIMQSIGSAMTYLMNLILVGFSTTAAAVFGVYFKLQSFVFMPIFGLNNGLVPIAAYNYGARKPERILGVFKAGVITSTALMIVGFLAFQFFPAQLLGLFKPSETMLQIGVPALRTIAWSFLIAGYSIQCSSLFQALGHGMLSMWASIIRQLLALLPIAWLLAQSGNLDLVWFAFPAAEIICSALVTVFLFRVYRSQIQPMMRREKSETLAASI